MKKLILATAALASIATIPAPVSAQSAQERLDERYNRALAAGYKALMLCGAIGHAEKGITRRTPESVEEWELTGIQAPLDSIIRDLPYEIVRYGEGQTINRVEVAWNDEMPPRIAEYGINGCHVWPIGTVPPTPYIIAEEEERSFPTIGTWTDTINATIARPILEMAFNGTYGVGSRTTVVIVRKDGKVFDWAWEEGFSPFTPLRTWSVAKSIAATVVGAAEYRGQADVTASAGLGNDNYKDPRADITIDDALRMASGRYSDTPGNRTDPLYWGGTTVDERAQNWPLIHAPGSVSRYANNDTLAAVQAIEGTFEEISPRDLLSAIGMHNTVAETDWTCTGFVPVT